MNLILDIKSDEEIESHIKNKYRKNLFNRKKIICDKVFGSNNNLFLCPSKNFSSFAGSYYFNGNDPLVNTALECLKNPNQNLKDSYLYKYYENFQPQTYGDLYKLRKENKLHELKSTSYFHPWIHNKPTNIFRCGLFGPKHISNVNHRIIRITNIIKNINTFGYVPTHNDCIEGYILLKKKDDYRFLITGGHHRVAVLTAMYMNGNKLYESIPVKYDDKRVNIRVVKEGNVNNWPGVRSGWLKSEDALEMFNKYFI